MQERLGLAHRWVQKRNGGVKEKANIDKRGRYPLCSLDS